MLNEQTSAGEGREIASGVAIERSVHACIKELLERRERPVEAFSNDDDLMSTGLTSLDLAAVIALLERHWRVDPFLQHIAITEVRTVGDLCRAYALCLSGADVDDEDLEQEAMDRARRRRE